MNGPAETSFAQVLEDRAPERTLARTCADDGDRAGPEEPVKAIGAHDHSPGWRSTPGRFQKAACLCIERLEISWGPPADPAFRAS